jgi:hypothetical protein
MVAVVSVTRTVIGLECARLILSYSAVLPREASFSVAGRGTQCSMEAFL